MILMVQQTIKLIKHKKFNMKKIIIFLSLVSATNLLFAMPGKKEFVEYYDKYTAHYVSYGENELFIIKIANTKNKWEAVHECEWTILSKNKGVYNKMFVSFEDNEYGQLGAKKIPYEKEKLDLAIYKMNCKRV